jgi:ubiquinone/menaquinone biosynthesis C-methylase UbiE
MTGNSPEELFNAIARDYDSIARRGMPRYDEMLDAIVACLVDGPGDVLELGCGTGALTARLAERYPDARIHAIDASPEMLELAEARIVSAGVAAGGMVGETSFAHGRFEDLDLAGHSYDLIASNMSLHHIEDKGPFYGELHSALRPGGLLVFGDELKGALPHIEERHLGAWRDFASRQGGLSQDELDTIERHSTEIDHYETLPRQLELLGEAGFEQVDCVWRYLNYGVFVCQA